MTTLTTTTSVRIWRRITKMILASSFFIQTGARPQSLLTTALSSGSSIADKWHPIRKVTRPWRISLMDLLVFSSKTTTLRVHNTMKENLFSISSSLWSFRQPLVKSIPSIFVHSRCFSSQRTT